MVQIGGPLFRDVVSGEPVCRFKDKFGRVWLATGAWSQFRIGGIRDGKKENQ